MVNGCSKPTNGYNRWPVTCNLTGRKIMKAPTSLRPFSRNERFVFFTTSIVLTNDVLVLLLALTHHHMLN
jgi:hypothetical protein